MIVECGKGCLWFQSGNRTGHCSQCHLTFDGIAAFDSHQRVDSATGRMICRDPAEVLKRDRSPVFSMRESKGVTYWRLDDPVRFVQNVA